MKKLLILDRDGVINEDSDDYVKSVDEWQPIPGSIEAIAALSKAGWTICVATNQSGLGRGYFSEADLAAMHTKLHALVAEKGGNVHDIFCCPHRPDEACDCRKPAPGLIDRIIAKYGDVSGCWFVGDTRRDLEAGIARGMQPILVRTGKGEKTLRDVHAMPGLRVFNSLSDVARELLHSPPAA